VWTITQGCYAVVPRPGVRPASSHPRVQLSTIVMQHQPNVCVVTRSNFSLWSTGSWSSRPSTRTSWSHLSYVASCTPLRYASHRSFWTWQSRRSSCSDISIKSRLAPATRRTVRARRACQQKCHYCQQFQSYSNKQTRFTKNSFHGPYFSTILMAGTRRTQEITNLLLSVSVS